MSKHIKNCLWIFLLSFTTFAFAQTTSSPLDLFKENTSWLATESASVVNKKLLLGKKNGNVIAIEKWQSAKPLVSTTYWGDSVIELDFLLAESSSAIVLLQGRYAIELKDNTSEWQRLQVKYRVPRFDESGRKTDKFMILEARLNDEQFIYNELRDAVSPDTIVSWEETAGPFAIKAKGVLALRNIKILPADFSKIQLPEKSGEPTNEQTLIDFVALGKETFDSVGCNACHLIEKNSTGVSTGPNLFGLFKREPRDREVIEGGEGHRVTIKANRPYLHQSLRDPSLQIALRESGDKSGEAYLPIMPAFNAQTLSDAQIDAIGDYLATLNDLKDSGPVIKLQPVEGEAAYDPIKDRLQLLVNDQVRIQRGPMTGASGRAVHVGTPWGVNYTFDPRLLAITKIWQGGFLDMSGEWLNRGGRGLKMGYESRELNMGSDEFLFAPLNAKNQVIDFSFKEAKFGDAETLKKSLHSKQDHLDTLAGINAQFEGYTHNSRDKNALPEFQYRVGDNQIKIKTHIAANGKLQLDLDADNKTDQVFALNASVLKSPQVSAGRVENNRWILPKGKTRATLTANLQLVDKVWRPSPSTFDYTQQKLRVTDAKANMPAGYSIENYYPPLDNFGREQLFEALGLALSDDNTLVVATRTAGIWRLVKGEWKLFAEGTFDSLGVVIEDKKGLVVVAGQKAELTRISDTNGDGVADKYETLFDAHSYHGNYHSYMHGPVRGSDGAYYLTLNLAHDSVTYNGGGAYMGTAGGFAGWAIRVQPDKKFTLWANGLRSPASLGVGPDKKLWYADNQGEYMGTSKLFVIEKDHFYGHPSALVDLPGMTPDSKELLWDAVKNKRTHAVVLLPHNRLANSPGNPAWDLTGGKFGPYQNQMLMGDQTQSNLFRITTEKVGDHWQGVVIPFMDGLESGVMRPLFLKDGSLLLGQTGRGWQAKGGHVASLQHIKWDGKTVAPAIKNVTATATGFAVELTQPLLNSVNAEQIQKALKLESWVYRDAPDYGSDELGLTQEKIKSVSISKDAKQIYVDLESLAQPKVHPEQTARVYHLSMQADKWFANSTTDAMQAYYSLYEFPTAK